MIRAVRPPVRRTLAVPLLLLGACTASGDESRPSETEAPEASSALGSAPGLIHGRVTMEDGTVYEGRLRWGGDEEALWIHHFNGRKLDNPWVDRVRPDDRPRTTESLGAFGVEVSWDRESDLARPFLARFGDIARIEAGRREIRVVLRSGAESVLHRYEADDLADGLRIWDPVQGVVDIGEWRIASVEFFAAPPSAVGPRPLHGTVRTTQGTFTGFLQWDREAALGSDVLVAHGADGEMRVAFDDVARIERQSPESAVVTLIDGRELVLSGTRQVGDGHRGIYVDDARYGRVLVSWDVFEGAEFDDGGPAPGYDDFPIGGPLTGTVTTRSGERLPGRLVYDLDESEITETLDAPWRGVDYLVTFEKIAAIELPGGGRGGPPAVVTLRTGETLELERAGDLGPDNGGLLVFADGEADPTYVPWRDVARVDLEG